MRRALPLCFAIFSAACAGDSLSPVTDAAARDREEPPIELDAGVPPINGMDAGAEDAAAPEDAGTEDDAETAARDAAPIYPDAAPIHPDAAPVFPDATVDPCATYPYSAAELLAERVGFGADTTGGDPTNVYRVTSLDDTGPGTLRDALESNESRYVVFDVEGDIDVEEPIEIYSDKTVDGRGRNITVHGVDGAFKLEEGAQNIILSDIAVTSPDNGDAIGVRGVAVAVPEDYPTRNLWFHHLELFHGYDGLLDLRGVSKVTVSWNHYHTHKKAMLVWKDNNQDPSPGTRVTFHHNYFERITLRGPLMHYGYADFFNNYQFEWYEVGLQSVDDAQVLSENNIYEARPGRFCFSPCPDPNPMGDSDFVVSKEAVMVEWSDSGPGNVKSVGDWTLNDAEIVERNAGDVFDRADYYVAVPEPANNTLKQAIIDGAGPRVDYCR